MGVLTPDEMAGLPEEEPKIVINGNRPRSGHLIFSTKGCEDFIVLKPNGDFLVKGKFTTNDMDLYEAMKEWVTKANRSSHE